MAVVALLLGIGLAAVAIAASTASSWADVQVRRWRDARRFREIFDPANGRRHSVEQVVARDLACLAIHDPAALDDATRRTHDFEVDAWRHALAAERLTNARLHARRPGALRRAGQRTVMVIVFAAAIVIGALATAASSEEVPSMALVAFGVAFAAAALGHRRALGRRPETLAAVATFAAVPRGVAKVDTTLGFPQPSGSDSGASEAVADRSGHEAWPPVAELADLSWHVGQHSRNVADRGSSVGTTLPLTALALVEIGRTLV